MLEIKQLILNNNDCYKSNKNKKHTVRGIMVHSTGANNPYLKRYLGPDDGIIGQNQYGNHWNQSGVSKCVHAMIGKDINGVVRVYQTLPWEMPGWHSGTGSLGKDKNANNNGYIGFEILEDDLTNENYFNEVYNKAVELVAYLCDKYSIDVNNIIGHVEGHKMGIASNHGDPEHWFKKFNKSMDTFRADVKKLLEHEEEHMNMLTYKVQPGDALYKIAQKYNITTQELINANPQLTNPNIIHVGDVLYIPVKEEPKADYKTLYEAEKAKVEELEIKNNDLSDKLQSAEGRIRILETKIINAQQALKLESED
jgi:N-acetylmuramoyl-L-alanine amidase